MKTLNNAEIENIRQAMLKDKTLASWADDVAQNLTYAQRKDFTRYEADVLRSAKENHIWLNAFTCVSPSQETLLGLGAAVMNMLKSEERTIVSDIDDGPFAHLGWRSLIVRLNKS